MAQASRAGPLPGQQVAPLAVAHRLAAVEALVVEVLAALVALAVLVAVLVVQVAAKTTTTTTTTTPPQPDVRVMRTTASQRSAAGAPARYVVRARRWWRG